MKRWIGLLAGFALAVFLAPSKEMDISALRPVELLFLYKEDGMIGIKTDTGDSGTGADLSAAVEDLKATAPGEIFLDTADYVMVTAETKGYLRELKEILRPAAEVVLAQGEFNMSEAVEFLRIHNPGMKLKDYRSEDSLPVLAAKEGRYYLEE